MSRFLSVEFMFILDDNLIPVSIYINFLYHIYILIFKLDFRQAPNRLSWRISGLSQPCGILLLTSCFRQETPVLFDNSLNVCLIYSTKN